MLVNWQWKLICKTRLSPQVICFRWLALHEVSLTQDNLIRRKIHIVNRCFMCHQTLEINRHLLHCQVATGICNMFISVFGLKWVVPSSVKDALVSWSSWKVIKPVRKVWKMILLAFFWCVWTERNNRCFEGTSSSSYILES